MVWVLVIGAGSVALWALSIAYELGALMIVAALFWGGFKLIGAVVPESWKPVSRAEFEEVRDTAADALNLAQAANDAVENGSSSDSAMGTEIQEAKDAAEQAQSDADAAGSEAEQAKAKADELEARLDAICNKAPALCY
jgi:hypothetical protein